MSVILELDSSSQLFYGAINNQYVMVYPLCQFDYNNNYMKTHLKMFP